MIKRILFINAVAKSQTGLQHLGLGYLVSSLRQHFGNDAFEFKIIDTDVEKTIHDWQPEIVGITVVSENWGIAVEYSGIAKGAGCIVIVGGEHVTALPETMTRNMDIAVIGEGEQTIVEIMEYYCDTKPLGYGDINGIAFWHTYHGESIVVSNPPREIIQNLDTLPFPARDLMPHNGTETMLTARGCPYRCVFCASSHYWGKLRFFSPEYVVAEIKELVETYHAKHIEILDDLFIADKARFVEIVRLLGQAGILGKVDFLVQTRANLMDSETASLLKRMNAITVWMGLESGCPRTLDYLKGQSVTLEDNVRAIKALVGVGIRPNGFFIIGSPTETKEEVLQTLDFIRRSQLNTFQIHLLLPFPGTPVWDYAMRRGLVSNDMDWQRLAMGQGDNAKDAIILSEVLTRDEIFALYKLFLEEKTRRKVLKFLHNPLLGFQYSREIVSVIRRLLTGKNLFNQ
jgi:radical SAM superfamily enzyme YgiQ (UPF0313 family)